MDIFSALAEPTRREIVGMLASHDQMSATDIYKRFNVSNPAISQHLKILREADLVSMEKRGQQHIYRLNPKKMIEMEKWAKRMTATWNERFDRLDNLLASETKKNAKKG